MREHSGSWRSRGFNISELLVVIALITLLAAILVPLLKHGRRQSNRAKCMSNMRQLGKAFQAYIEDWQGRWPSPGGLKGDRSYWAQSGSGGLVPYVQSKGGLKTVWCCPELNQWEGIYPPRSYGMNSYMRDPMDWEWISVCGEPLGILNTCGIHDSDIVVPSKTILLYEGIPETGSSNMVIDHIDRCGNWTQVRGWFSNSMPRLHSIDSNKPWHGILNNYIYCDGHAASFAPNKHPNAPSRDCTNEWYVAKFRSVPKGKGR